MIPQTKRLSQLPIPQDTTKLDRNLLKDMAAEALRDYVSAGFIPEGTKLTEREVSQIFNMSRMPARDALMVLEKEGLVQSRPDGRYVVTFTEEGVYALYQVRRSLEKLAAELAAVSIDAEGCATLRARLRELQVAVSTGDADLCTKRDMALHREIWRQAQNPYVLRILESLVGLIFVLAARVNFYGKGDLRNLLEEHCRLVELIASGDGIGAGQVIENDLAIALADSLRTFRIAERASPAQRTEEGR